MMKKDVNEPWFKFLLAVGTKRGTRRRRRQETLFLRLTIWLHCSTTLNHTKAFLESKIMKPLLPTRRIGMCKGVVKVDDGGGGGIKWWEKYEKISVIFEQFVKKGESRSEKYKRGSWIFHIFCVKMFGPMPIEGNGFLVCLFASWISSPWVPNSVS